MGFLIEKHGAYSDSITYSIKKEEVGSCDWKEPVHSPGVGT